MSSKVFSSLMAESLLLSKAAQIVAGYSPITIFLFSVITIFFVVYNKRRARLVKYIERIPGPAALPFVGNAIEMNVDHDGEFSELFVNCSFYLTLSH